MKKSKGTERNRLFVRLAWGIAIILMLILVQGFTHVLPLKKLGGYVKEPKKVSLTYQSFSDGSYQDYLAERAKQKGGFKEFFVRAYNQMMHDCFGIISNQNLIKGENDEFFLRMYLDEAMGKTLIKNYSTIDSAKLVAQENVAKTLVLIDTLKNHGIAFLPVFAPTKTATYPEWLPQEYRDSISDFSLEEYYVQLFKENGINHIDFYSYFKSLKKEFPYPLYTKLGTHWAESTIPFVADSIMRKIEEITGFDLPTVECADINLTTHYSGQDKELENLMNLLFPLKKKEKLPNPKTALTDTVGKDKPNILVIADSYFVQLRRSAFIDAFANWDYWKYNKEIISSNPKYNNRKVSYLPEAYQVVDSADIILAVFTAPYLYEYLCGFCETVSDFYGEEGAVGYEKKIQAVIDQIKNDPEWMEKIKKQAKERGITMDENLRDNAIYVLKKQREQ